LTSKYNTYLYLEPFVIANAKGTNLLLYNLYTKKFLEIKNSIKLSKIVKKIISYNNMYFIKINMKEQLDAEFKDFVLKLKANYMGDLVQINNNYIPPIQIKPVPKILSENNNGSNEYLRSKKDILKYLTTISIYINNKLTKNEIKINKLSNQYLLNSGNEKSNNILKFEIIVKLLEECKNSSLSLLNILGGNILKYPSLSKLLNYLSEKKIKTNLHFIYSQFINNRQTIEHIITNYSINKLIIHVYPIKLHTIKDIYKISKKKLDGFVINFYISNLEEYNLIAKEIEEKNFNNLIYKIKPIVEKGNYQFWADEIFWDRNDIFNMGIKKNEIFANYELNSLEFGKLIIKSNGDVFANVNNKSLGNICNDKIINSVFNEYKLGESWFKIRKDVKPCNNCVYNLFCPPISNFEYIFNKNNLCNIG